ncbi:MAG: hypothetical protein WDO73_22645 [Ignavibacteriota bacterium]
MPATSPSFYQKGYETYGIVRRVAVQDPIATSSRVRHLLNSLHTED